jgi:hypothetical protein
MGFQNQMLKIHGAEFIKTFESLCLTHIYLDNVNLLSIIFQELQVALKHVSEPT